MTTEEIKKAAEELVTNIKNCFKEAKKNGKSNPLFNLEIWNCKKNGECYWYVAFDNKEFGKFNNEYDISRFFTFVRGMLNDLKKVRGYKHLIFEESEHGNYPYYYNVIDNLGLMDNPCKEYVQLQKYITKYGKYKLGNFEIYEVRMFGKRGSVDTEMGKRRYLDHDAKKCASYLEILRRARGAKDKMICEYTKDNIYIDPEERRASMYYECECEGVKESYLTIEFRTPSGKTKSKIRIQ